MSSSESASAVAGEIERLRAERDALLRRLRRGATLGRADNMAVTRQEHGLTQAAAPLAGIPASRRPYRLLAGPAVTEQHDERENRGGRHEARSELAVETDHLPRRTQITRFHDEVDTQLVVESNRGRRHRHQPRRDARLPYRTQGHQPSTNCIFPT